MLKETIMQNDLKMLSPLNMDFKGTHDLELLGEMGSLRSLLKVFPLHPL
ncbi:MAG: hypothetical protein QE164_02505 [Candidatus Nezhaarchaeota archaeon]|nr:hypothetical protein [Candidatus Nezhaarchaeota archaeon]